MDQSFTVPGNIVDVVGRRIFRGLLKINDGKIQEITETDVPSGHFILPGFIDAHVHIESSMLTPAEFARLAVVHGTVAAVSDPHEIANVMGIDGIRYMISNGKLVPFHFYFGAPSCVPATPFETSGAFFGERETEELLSMTEINYLSEMMNYPGVLNRQPEVMAKIQLAKRYNKPVDGHAPGLTGDSAVSYAGAGISTDHECTTYQEALDKIHAGMKILIREGSAARNFETLIPLISDFPDKIMLCSDDKHPDSLLDGHINLLARRAIAAGYDWMSVLRSCSYNPVKHYSLDAGLLQKGDNADFILVDSLTDLNILETWVNGVKVAEKGKTLIPSVINETPNVFGAGKLETDDILVKASGNKIRVLKALDGQLVTDVIETAPLVKNGNVIADTDRDILKLIVLNRYKPAKPGIAFVHNFGLKKGAMASTVAHDSHNIIAVGTSDQEIVNAVNLIIDLKGGISVVREELQEALHLPVAGLMSDKDAFYVAERYKILDRLAKSLGSELSAPFMTLSFMALLVIPSLKLSDLGLFDGNIFTFTDIDIH